MIHTLEGLGFDALGYDYKKLADLFITDNGKYNKNILYKMYGARFPAEIDQAKHHRDDAFYRHVEDVLGIKVFYGQFKGEKYPVEKGVDVRIATDLIIDAFYNNYDQAYIFSSDTDLLPAIESVCKMFSKKILVCLNYDMKHLSDEFKKVNAIPLTMSKKILSQFKPIPVSPSSTSMKLLEKKFSK